MKKQYLALAIVICGQLWVGSESIFAETDEVAAPEITNPAARTIKIRVIRGSPRALATSPAANPSVSASAALKQTFAQKRVDRRETDGWRC